MLVIKIKLFILMWKKIDYVWVKILANKFDY